MTAPLSAGNLERIKQDAERGLGASSGDTLRLLAEIKRMTAIAYGAHGAFRMETLAERDQLKVENERLRKLPTCWSEVLEQAEANDELLDKVLQLSADAERYRFLCDKFGETKLPCALERILAGDLYVADGKPSIDSAIDVAMGKGEQS